MDGGGREVRLRKRQGKCEKRPSPFLQNEANCFSQARSGDRRIEFIEVDRRRRSISEAATVKTKVAFDADVARRPEHSHFEPPVPGVRLSAGRHRKNLTPAIRSSASVRALPQKPSVTELPTAQEKIIGTATIAVPGLLAHTNSGSSKR